MPDKGVLTIDDPEAVELAAEVERLSGRSATSVVVQALKAEAARLRSGPIEPEEQERIAAEIRKIQDELRSWPVVDPRSPDELLEYNEDGLFD